MNSIEHSSHPDAEELLFKGVRYSWLVVPLATAGLTMGLDSPVVGVRIIDADGHVSITDEYGAFLLWKKDDSGSSFTGIELEHSIRVLSRLGYSILDCESSFSDILPRWFVTVNFVSHLTINLKLQFERSLESLQDNASQFGISEMVLDSPDPLSGVRISEPWKMHRSPESSRQTDPTNSLTSERRTDFQFSDLKSTSEAQNPNSELQAVRVHSGLIFEPQFRVSLVSHTLNCSELISFVTGICKRTSLEALTQFVEFEVAQDSQGMKLAGPFSHLGFHVVIPTETRIGTSSHKLLTLPPCNCQSEDSADLMEFSRALLHSITSEVAAKKFSDMFQVEKRVRISPNSLLAVSSLLLCRKIVLQKLATPELEVSYKHALALLDIQALPRLEVQRYGDLVFEQRFALAKDFSEYFAAYLLIRGELFSTNFAFSSSDAIGLERMAMNNLIVEPIIKHYSSILNSEGNPENVVPLGKNLSLTNVLMARTLMQNSINQFKMLTGGTKLA